MKHPTILAMLSFLVLAAPACGGDSGGGNGGSTGGSNGGSAGSGGAGGAGGNSGVTCAGTTLTASEASNYAFSSTLTFPAITVAAKTELTLDWSGVTKSFLGHPLDTKQDLDTILVMLWKLPLSTLEQKTNADSLLMRDLVTLPLQYTTDGSGTSAKLFQFTNTGAPTQEQVLGFLDPAAYPPENYTYTLMVATGDKLGEGTRMIQSFHVDSNNTTETTVKINSNSTKLTWEAHLQNAKPTGIPAAQPAITLDWSGMKTNALGNPFVPTDAITKVLIGHYNESVTELETKFLDIELIATELYRGEILSGTSIDFSTLKLSTDANKTFPGINASGTWLVALQCGTCRNPAPWYLSVLKPCQ